MVIGILIALLGAIVAYAIHIPRTIAPDEVTVLVRLGKPVDVWKSGLHAMWLWPVEKLRKYPTTQQEIELGIAHIITKALPGKEEHNSVKIQAEVALYWFWPQDEKLLNRTIKVVANPLDENGLKDVFQEPTLELVRSVGMNFNWEEFIRERSLFNAAITTALDNDQSHPIKQAGLNQPRVIITRVTLPAGLEESISAQEIARLNKMAAIQQAEAEAQATKIKKIAEGEGAANARKEMGKAEADAKRRDGTATAFSRKKLFEAIGENRDLETLLRFAEAAQGPSNTLWVLPTQIVDVINRSLGRATANPLNPGQQPTTFEDAVRVLSPVIDGLAPDQRGRVLNALGEFVKTLTGNQ